MSLFNFTESCEPFLVPIQADELNESIQLMQEKVIKNDIDILLNKPIGLVSELEMYGLYESEIIESAENVLNEENTLMYSSLLESAERLEYGLPNQQKFPIRNPKEINQTLTMFRFSDLKDREELSRNIITEALLQDVPISENHIIFKYSDITYDKYLEEKEKLYAPMEKSVNRKEEVLNKCLQEGINIDSDGNMIIKLREKTDFMSKYNTSHKLLKIYMATNNTEGVKTELCKLWYMYTIIEYYYSGKNNINIIQQKLLQSNREDALKAKGFIMNDFTNGLKWLLNREPSFDFSEYFSATDYYKDIIKIDSRIMKLLKNIVF